MRQQGALQAAGDGGLGVVEAGAFEGLGDQAAEGGEDGAVLGGEGAGPVEAEDEAADGVAGGDQREERPGLHLVARDAGVGGGEFALGLEEDRRAGGEHLGAGQPGADRGAFERVEEAGLVTAFRDQVHASGVGQVEGEFLAAEAGQDLVDDGRGDLLDGDGLGQPGRELQDVVDAADGGGGGRRGLGQGDVGAGAAGTIRPVRPCASG